LSLPIPLDPVERSADRTDTFRFLLWDVIARRAKRAEAISARIIEIASLRSQ